MLRSIVFRILTLPLCMLFAQSPDMNRSETFPAPAVGDSFTVRLSAPFIIPSSIVVSVDSMRIRSYRFDRRSGTISGSLPDVSSRQAIITVTYSAVELGLRRTFRRHALILQADSLEQGKVRPVVTSSNTVFSNVFGPELSRNGSISRGFIVGSNRDLTLSSGFRLQMAGRLADDIDIVAALTDENTPIQPQGNTQTLQEIDNVFVEIKSPSATATVGDFVFSSRSGQFVNVNRKLQGARLAGDQPSLLSGTQGQIAAATSRGKYHSNAFQGIEAVQGPYRMTGKNNERAIMIIAGSEKVYIDGDRLTRGENGDYTIDYGSAEVTFTARRLITAASRIIVDFEYADRQYTRNFFGSDIGVSPLKGLDLRIGYFRESDDPDAPIDLVLNASEREALRKTGDGVATVSGVVLVGTDSLGNGRGTYRSVDTTVSGTAFRFYRFEQGTPDAVYAVSFSPVGQGNGDYRREGIGRYVFAGIGAGTYAPVIMLPAPQLQQMYAVSGTFEPFHKMTLTGEYAASDVDRNRFSEIGDGSLSGGAYAAGIRFAPDNITVSGFSLGKADISISERYKQSRFAPLDRTEEVEFGRKWSTDSLTTGPIADERIREASLIYLPVDQISLTGGYGSLRRSEQFMSDRYHGALDVRYPEVPTISYQGEHIRGKELQQLLSNTWNRHRADVAYAIAGLSPGLRMETENRTVRRSSNDSVLNASYAFRAIAPSITVSDIAGIEASAELEWRDDDAVGGNALIRQSNAVTQQYSATLKELHSVTASAMLAFRSKTFAREFQSAYQNHRTTLMKVQTRYRPYNGAVDLDLFYDAATQRTAKLERYFYKVRKGEGQYSWQDANGNGIVDLNDEREFLPDRYDGEYVALTLNSDNYIPVVTLKSSARLRLTPSRILSDQRSGVRAVLSALSSETFARLEERSTEPDVRRIYVLDMDAFLRPQTTLMGYQFIQQDLFLFEFRPEYSFRFRFNQRKGLSQFSSGSEQNYNRERSLRMRVQLSDDISNQTDLLVKDDRAVSSSLINRTRSIDVLGLSTDLSYRPERNMEIGMKLETTESHDRAMGNIVPASYNGQTVRLVYGFLGNGQARLEAAREEVLIGVRPGGYQIPYELTGGRELGKQYLWSLSSEYRMTGNVQFSVQYSGRTANSVPVIHTGRMEVRAYF